MAAALPAWSHEWKPARDRDGIQVFTRKVDGLAFKQFKGVATIDAPVASLLAVFEDLDAASRWVSHCESMELIERISPTETYVYSRSPAPWPIKDRDAIVRNMIFTNEKTGVVRITQTAAPDRLDRRAKTIRIERIEGAWTFTPRSDGKTEVVYQVLTDPGGGIPAWLINRISVSMPYDVLHGIREIAGDEKYSRR